MGPVLVCETVRAETLADLRRAREAVTGADLVELRLDFVGDPDPVGAIAGRRTPVVVTCRPRWEGGAFDGDEATRRAILTGALRAGAEFIDVEWAAPWRAEALATWGDRIVLSWHEFSGTPAGLAARARDMLAAGAAVTKIAVTPARLRDLDPLLAFGHQAGGDRRLVLIGMGPMGLVTRVLPHRFGSCWTYAGPGVAPGQVPTARLIDEYRVRAATPATAVFGVVGRPVGHSLSPAMHNAAFAAGRMDAVYVPFEAADFGDFQWAADTFDVVGASVTAPFKEEARRAAARVDRVAEEVGAANTLRREPDGGWAARNTDLEGFLTPLGGIPLSGARVAVLGAGGAARAVVAALVGRQARVTVHARRPEAAQALAGAFATAAGAWPPEPGSWDVLVNTTPVGTWPDETAMPLEASFVHGTVVYDLVYNPPDTALLRAAASQGCRVIGGLDMLVAQAARQFEWWTGRTAPREVMRAAAARRLVDFGSPEAGGAGER